MSGRDAPPRMTIGYRDGPGAGGSAPPASWPVRTARARPRPSLLGFSGARACGDFSPDMGLNRAKKSWPSGGRLAWGPMGGGGGAIRGPADPLRAGRLSSADGHGPRSRYSEPRGVLTGHGVASWRKARGDHSRRTNVLHSFQIIRTPDRKAMTIIGLPLATASGPRRGGSRFDRAIAEQWTMERPQMAQGPAAQGPVERPARPVAHA